MPNRAWWVGITIAASACSRPLNQGAPVRLEVGVEGLSLHPAIGVRINAKVKPTLELTDGGRITFDQGAVDADSAYFAEPPRAAFHPTGGSVSGTLRVGVCPAGMSVCQSLTLPVSGPLATP